MITVDKVKEISKKIISESVSMSLPNGVKDNDIAVLNAGFGKLIMKLYEFEEEEEERISKLPKPDMRCGSCSGRLIWRNGSYTHAEAMFERHGAWAVEEWDE